MEVYKGACHCGKVQYEVQGDFKTAIECNCSMCGKKGTLLAFVPEGNFKLISGSDALSDYQFNKKVLHHTFCKNCGVTSFISGQDRSGHGIKAINLRCIENLDLARLEIKQVDGKSF